jgi:hypothetical protein
MEQLELLKVSRETKYKRGDVFRFGQNAGGSIVCGCLRRGQLVGAAFVVVARSSVAEDVEAKEVCRAG